MPAMTIAWWLACAAWLVWCSACGYPSLAARDAGGGDDATGSSPGIDAAIDAAIDASPDARLFCYGTGIVQVCFAAAPTQPLTLFDNSPIDTSAPPSSTPGTCAPVASGGGGYCVIVATTVTFDGEVRAIGPKPLVVVASDAIMVTTIGAIDVASHRGLVYEIGAGGDPTICAAGTLPTKAATSGGGGAGGSLAGRGGNGGNGGDGGNAGISGPVVTTFPELRGGCPGQDGAEAVTSTRGVRGHGGGAVYLIAGNTITVQGTINASGESGAQGGVVGGAGGAGGGGGGAGGMIGFDAPTISATGVILASGGGGGGASGQGVGTAGNPGADPTSTAAAAGGGGGGGLGGGGAAGSARVIGGPGGNASNGAITTGAGGGGGGGGGAAGLIRAPATASFGSGVSPLPTP